MYWLSLNVNHLSGGKSMSVHAAPDQHTIAKWTFLPATPAGRQQLNFIALAGANKQFAHKIVTTLLPPAFARNNEKRQIEVCMALHPDHDHSHTGGRFQSLSFQPTHQGIAYFPVERNRSRPAGITPLRVSGRHIGKHFLLAYGPTLKVEKSTVFDFSDPSALNKRIQSLFDPHLRLTNPPDLFSFMQHKIRFGRRPKRAAITALSEYAGLFLHEDTRHWISPDFKFIDVWHRLSKPQQRALLPVFDIIRHYFDARLRNQIPLLEPALILMDRPDKFVSAPQFTLWLELLDALFPAAQFVMTLTPESQGAVPTKLKEKRLTLPTQTATPTPPKPSAPATRRSADIALIDVDGRLPNLALMKISGHFKARGLRTLLARKEILSPAFREVWASSIFYDHHSLSRVERLRQYYGDNIQIGGSGVNITCRLPTEIDQATPDYGLYPELGDRAIGFLTRGCPKACDFCIVPRKEGKPRQVASLEELLQKRKKLILLDDNLLAHPSALQLLEQMAQQNIAVNFNQTLDLSLVNQDFASLLRRIQAMNVRFTRPCLYFSLNHANHLEQFQRAYDLFNFTGRDNVEFICMYGFNTTLADDVTRFRFLKSLPGAYVFTQRYKPFAGAPEPDLDNFFGTNPDRLLDELVRIVFTQNMKNMEVYYRWLSRLYAERFGHLHMGLVDTIFRYNARHRKGRYIATLASTKSPMAKPTPETAIPAQS